MSPVPLRKKIARAFVVSWREQPTRFDIEALQENVRRVGLVVYVRWMLIFVLGAYSLIAGALYLPDMGFAELAGLMALPAASLVFVVLYNAFYSLNYRRLGNITVWNNLQLALDALVVTVLVYFSGGVDSWFWSMYALFILEAAFILPNLSSTWVHALFSCALLAAVEGAEFAGWMPHQAPPFGNESNYANALFVGVRYLWQVTVLLGVASVATKLVGEFRRELADRRGKSLLDEATGLYSRSYFMRAMTAELRRAERTLRPVHVMLIDFDRFGEFNRRFGIDAGDRLLKLVADAIAGIFEPAGDVMTTANVMARYGGEEFVVLFVEDARGDTAPDSAGAAFMAEQVRAAVEGVRENGAGVTVSIGLASAPADGVTGDSLLDSADSALAEAAASGGNRVCVASDLVHGEE